MRVGNGGTPVRGERARVAQRVRAMLVDAGQGSVGLPPGPPDADLSVVPWLPGDDFATELSSAVAHVPPTEPQPRAQAAAHRASGLIGRLANRVPVRADPGRRGAIAIGIAALLATVITGGWVLSARPRSLPVTGSGADPAAVASARVAASSAGSLTPDPSIAAPSSSAAALVVDVAGRVRRPGLYHLPPGSRIDDAVRAAGGALSGVDLSSLNLAAKLADGQQISVGVPGSAPAAGAGVGSTGSAAPSSATLDLNSATLEQLETLPGVGPVLGQHIIDWRTAHGRFATIDQLREVSGIGDVKFAALRSRVVV